MSETEYMTWEEYVRYRVRYAHALRELVTALSWYDKARDIFYDSRRRGVTSWSLKETGKTTADQLELDEKFDIPRLHEELRRLQEGVR